MNVIDKNANEKPSRLAGGRVVIEQDHSAGLKGTGRNVRKPPEIRVFAQKYGLFLKSRPDG